MLGIDFVLFENLLLKLNMFVYYFLACNVYSRYVASHFGSRPYAGNVASRVVEASRLQK